MAGCPQRQPAFFCLYNAEILLKECFDLVNDTLFLGSSVAATKARDRRHQLVDVCACGLDSAIAQSIFNVFSCFILFEFFFCNEGGEIFFLLLENKLLPIALNISLRVDGGNKAINKLFLGAKLDARLDRSVDGKKNFLVLAVRFVVPKAPSSRCWQPPSRVRCSPLC